MIGTDTIEIEIGDIVVDQEDTEAAEADIEAEDVVEVEDIDIDLYALRMTGYHPLALFFFQSLEWKKREEHSLPPHMFRGLR